MALPPLPSQPNLRGYATPNPDGTVTLQVSSFDFAMRGLAYTILFPMLVLTFGLGIADGDAGATVVTVSLVGAGLGALFGLATMALAGVNSRRTRATVHPDGTLETATGTRLAATEVRKIRAGKKGRLSNSVGVMVATDRGEVALVNGALPMRADRLGAVVEWLSEVTGAPVDPSSTDAALGMSPRTAAALCYLPIQGLWLVFSVLVLFRGKDALSRAAARQSIAFHLITGVGLITLLIAEVLFFAAADVADVGVALGILSVAGLGIVRLGIGLFAMWRASQGRHWVIPGFAWATRDTPPVGVASGGTPDPSNAWSPPGAE